MNRIRIALVLVVISTVACTAPALSGSNDGGVAIVEPTQSGRPASLPASPADPLEVGVDLVPLHIPVFIFGQPTSAPHVQPGSDAIVRSIGRRKRLDMGALPSGVGTVAIHFMEISPPGHRWGEVMFPAERAAFREFARDRRLGSYLVMLTDVKVLRSPDPIPLTAYRWRRADVEAYARCGIPTRAIDACTSDFFAAAQMSIIDYVAARRGA